MFDYSYGTTHNEKVAREWGPGYPNCDTSNWVPLVAKNGVGFGRVHKLVAELLEMLLNECIDRGYPPKAGQCWGSVCRCSHRQDGSCAEDSHGNPIPSNHSYGIAIDFNSLDNPYGGSTFKMPSWVPELFRTYGFRWLGPAIQDWQHLDFAGNKDDARAMTEKARRDLMEDPRVDALIEGFKAALRDDPKPDGAVKELAWKVVTRALNSPQPGAHNHPEKADVVHAHEGEVTVT